MTTDSKNAMTTANVVDSILQLIRNRLYSDKQNACFHQDRKQLIYAITWPSHWLQQRGLATSPKAYYSLIAQRIEEIARHGHSEKYSQYLPSYMLKCIQQHLFHHGDQLYEKLKHIRNFIESIPIKTTREDTPSFQQRRFVQDMQRLHKIAAPIKTTKSDPSQMKLW